MHLMIEMDKSLQIIWFLDTKLRFVQPQLLRIVEIIFEKCGAALGKGNYGEIKEEGDVADDCAVV